MNLYFKFFFLLFKRIFVSKSHKLTDLCVSTFRVGLLDLDLNFHMNNGRFFSVMDLGRFDLLMRSGHFYKIFRAGYYPVVFSEAIVFKRSLNVYSKYEVHTQVNSWDKQFFYISQRFYSKGKEIASANVRACFKQRGRQGIVPTSDLFSFIGENYGEVNISDLSKKHVELDLTLLPKR